MRNYLSVLDTDWLLPIHLFFEGILMFIVYGFFDNVHDLLNFKVHQTKENYVGMCNVFINVIEIRMHIEFFSWLHFLADNN